MKREIYMEMEFDLKLNLIINFFLFFSKFLIDKNH